MKSRNELTLNKATITIEEVNTFLGFLELFHANPSLPPNKDAHHALKKSVQSKEENNDSASIRSRSPPGASIVCTRPCNSDMSQAKRRARRNKAYVLGYNAARVGAIA